MFYVQNSQNVLDLFINNSRFQVYPYSDGEDNVFYSMHDSADSLSTSSRRSSLEGNDKTLVVVINRRNKNMSLAQKQRSWETFPPKRRHHMCHKMSAPTPPMPPLRKADSFEGELHKPFRIYFLIIRRNKKNKYYVCRARGGGEEPGGRRAGDAQETKGRELTDRERGAVLRVYGNLHVRLFQLTRLRG